jgi:hypothetical protein
MSTMIRTQIYLPRDVYEALQKRGAEQGMTMAEQIRQALKVYLRQDGVSGVILREDDPIWQLIGAFASDVDDGSINHDKYIYGEEALR